MTEATGVHAHPTKKLGRRPPSNKPALHLADFVRNLPAHPLIDAGPTGVSWPMDHNDQWGDCVVAGADHALQAICALLGVQRSNWSDQQILDYYRTQNPTFDPATGAGDDGMDVQTFLAYLVKQGVILGFAKIDQSDPDVIQAAIYLGLAIVTGENLQVAQQDQATWDYVSGSPDWGGHCTCWVSYGNGDFGTVTWGDELDMTLGFVQHRVEEAWFVITQAHVDHPGFRDAFDLAGYAQAFQEITGRPFPVHVEPSPTPPAPTPAPPAPAPTPGPVDPADERLAQAAEGWVGVRHRGINYEFARAVHDWLVARGFIAATEFVPQEEK